MWRCVAFIVVDEMKEELCSDSLLLVVLRDA